MKVCLILPYFGKLPNYFNFFLKSASFNNSITWLLITDDKSRFDFPDNFIVEYKQFDQVKELVSNKLKIDVNLERGHNLCDMKPAYGLIFEEYLDGVDYWGHCDPDVIWGDFSSFINWDELKVYDKIFYLGHLSLYRNTIENNKRFMIEIDGVERYKEVFNHPIGTLFDEKFHKSINTIFLKNDFPVLLKSYAADIYSYNCDFVLSEYDLKRHKYFLSKNKMLFTWEDGKTFGYEFFDGVVSKKEYLYIHLQKRQMKNIEKIPNKVLLNNFSFSELNREITAQNFDNYYSKPFFNKQFFKIKYKSLRFKLKYFKIYFFNKI
jgi:hypothetical protein